MKRVKLVIACLAATLSLGTADGAGRDWPLYEPFEKWDPETPTEKRLDALISEVVATLEAGQAATDFGAWQSRDIASEYRDLRLTVPKTADDSAYTGRNFLFLRERFGIYFHARFKLSNLHYFVPSACRRQWLPDRRVDRVRIAFGGMSGISPHGTETRRELREKYRVSMIPYFEISCGNGVKLGLYDSAMLRRHDQVATHRGARAGKEPYSERWVGIAVYYPR